MHPDRGAFLRILAKRTIVGPDGEMLDHELYSPFEYPTWLVAEIGSAV
jgi:hypothetical protein